ncbi:MAG: peptidylprolyl isomerase [bacterium]
MTMDNARKGIPGLLVLAAAVALALAAGPVCGQDKGPLLIDRIVAIVDEEAILQSDLDRELELYRMDLEYQGQEIPADLTRVREELLQRLIESKLIIAAAKQADMTVDEDAISQSVEEKIQQFVEHFGSLENLENELRKNGMTLGDYRARMRTQLRDQQYLRLVVGKFIRPDVEVLENEVRDYYLAHLDEMPADPDSLTIADILVTVQPSLEVRQAVQGRVTAIQQALGAGGDFADVAREYSRGPAASRGGRIGSFGPGELFDPALNNAAFKLPVGQVSEPIVSARGVHLVRVDAVEEDGRRTLSQIFLPITVTQEDIDRAEQKIRTARDRIIAGEAFSLVAAEVSEDPGSARNGGVLGTFSLDDLSSQFQEVLRDLQPGTVSDPVLTPAGWYVFKVLDRTPGHMYTFDELKENLRQVVENQKIETALAKYVEGLRSRFFIDLKG